MIDTQDQGRSQRLWRQGDILIQETDPQDPTALKRVKRPILAQGERTAHRHEVHPPRAARLYLTSIPALQSGPGPNNDTVMLLHVVKDEARIVHPEHNPIPLEKGWYRIWRQREYSRWGVHPVAD